MLLRDGDEQSKDMEKSVGWVVGDRDDQDKGPEKNLMVRPVLLYAIFI